jgi:hypothetical protein
MPVTTVTPAPIRLRRLCCGYERTPELASISYAAARIFAAMARRSGLTVEMQDGSLSDG